MVAQTWAAILLLNLLVTFCRSEQTFNVEKYKLRLIATLADPSQRAALKQEVASIRFPKLFRKDNKDAVDELVCNICSATADAFIVGRVNLGIEQDQILEVASELCVDFDIENEEVCHGIINTNLELFLFIIDHKPDLLGSKVCSIFLQSYGCSSFAGSDWTVEVPEGVSQARDPNPTGESIKFVHISDFHYDPYYKPGGNANCKEPLCCQSDHEDPASEADACGYWGEYRASDSPIHLIENSLSEVRKLHSDAEFAIYTGDVISHRVWSTSVANNSRDLKLIYGLLNTSLDIPVFPILGNHEPHPLNVWAPDNITDISVATQWVFDIAAFYWSNWLPSDAIETIRRGGYYTVLVRRGLRIIGLNSNVGYIYNWWLFYDDEDPYGQLQWLVNVLAQSEANRESVYIISHVPPNTNECLSLWSVHYRRIVERFANTIQGQFNGHTHTDIFSVFYNSSEPTQAISTAFNGASVTTNVGKNPSYKVYFADTGSFEVLDYDEYSFNLTEANLTPDEPPRWFKLYSFKDAYGVDSLRPAALNALAENMARNKTLLQQYFVFKSRNSDAEVRAGCNDSCKKSNLCAIVKSAMNDNVRCEQLTEVYDNTP